MKDTETLDQLVEDVLKKRPANEKLPERARNCDHTRFTIELSAHYIAEVRRNGAKFLETEETTSALASATKWCFNSAKKGLLLYGLMGTGKTTIARALYNTLSPLCLDIYFIYARDFFNAMAAKDNVTVNRAMDIPVLFLDDLGCEPEFFNDYGCKRCPLSELIQHRYDKHLTTVISSNMDMDGIKERYGARVEDRIYETYDRIVFTGGDFRRIAF